MRYMLSNGLDPEPMSSARALLPLERGPDVPLVESAVSSPAEVAEPLPMSREDDKDEMAVLARDKRR